MRERGYITRNECLRMFISRLGAIVCTLKKEGMDITAEWKDGDYIYKLNDRPKSVEIYKVDGVEVARKVIW